MNKMCQNQDDFGKCLRFEILTKIQDGRYTHNNKIIKVRKCTKYGHVTRHNDGKEMYWLNEHSYIT